MNKLINPIHKISEIQLNARILSTKYYINANAHEFKFDMEKLISLFKDGIAICEQNIINDPYAAYIKKENI